VLCVVLSVRYTLLTGGRPFIINSLSGQLLTSGQLDHDTESTYLLTVRAELLTDSSLFSLTQVTNSLPLVILTHTGNSLPLVILTRTGNCLPLVILTHTGN